MGNDIAASIPHTERVRSGVLFSRALGLGLLIALPLIVVGVVAAVLLWRGPVRAVLDQVGGNDQATTVRVSAQQWGQLAVDHYGRQLRSSMNCIISSKKIGRAHV